MKVLFFIGLAFLAVGGSIAGKRNCHKTVDNKEISLSVDEEEKAVSGGDWSPDPCFPMCTTDSALTSPAPERHCVKTDCFDEHLCAE